MTKQISIFSSPFMLGFDEIERTLDKISRSGSDSYPPYDIEQCGENDFRIVIAVAGFTMDDLSVQMEQNQLVIRGKRQKSDQDEEVVYHHRGIATRQFQRAFVLAEDIEVDGASLENGLLAVRLKRIVPDITIQKIKIDSPSKSGSKQIENGSTIDVTGDHTK